MEAQLKVDLLSVLDEWITGWTGRRNVYLSRSECSRVTGIAEAAALHHFETGASLDAAFHRGARAFVSEVRSTGPLTFIRERKESEWEPSFSESVEA